LIFHVVAEAGTLAQHVKQLTGKTLTAERPGKPLHKVRGLKVCFLPNA